MRLPLLSYFDSPHSYFPYHLYYQIFTPNHFFFSYHLFTDYYYLNLYHLTYMLWNNSTPTMEGYGSCSQSNSVVLWI